ncbi:MAG: hypothetical protein H6621_13090 [Halobacteriovoraceae bacterium]|nr:hypothetical protein [Halobacteriovoraceae bacterium]
MNYHFVAIFVFFISTQSLLASGSVKTTNNCKPKLSQQESEQTDNTLFCEVNRTFDFTAFAFSNSLTHLLDGLTSSCSKEQQSPRDEKIKFITSQKTNECKIVKNLGLSQAEAIGLNKPQCEKALAKLLQKAQFLPINAVYIDKYSEFCEPQKLEIKAYCCPSRVL